MSGPPSRTYGSLHQCLRLALERCNPFAERCATALEVVKHNQAILLDAFGHFWLHCPF